MEVKARILWFNGVISYGTVSITFTCIPGCVSHLWLPHDQTNKIMATKEE